MWKPDVLTIRGSGLMPRIRALVAVMAVVLGSGGLLTASAAEVSVGSVFVPIAPIRVLDTRIGAGLGGALASDQPAILQVTGAVATVLPGDVISSGSPVPVGATGVVTNTTVVGPSTIGYLAVRPGSAVGEPATSSINFTSPGAIVPNAVTVELPTTGPGAGAIQLWFHGTSATATTHVLVDIVGYYQPAGTNSTPIPGPSGPAGQAGLAGAAGPKGPGGVPGVPFRRQVVTEHLTDGRQPGFTDATIGANGMPIIVYNDQATDALTVLACVDRDCSAAPVANVVDANGDRGAVPSIAVGANGNPLISYRDASGQRLRVATCSTATCAGAATLTTIDSGSTTGAESSIAIGTNGNPVVAYRGSIGTNSSLLLAFCQSTTCTGTRTIVPLDTGAGTAQSTADGTGTGWFPSIAVGATGAPLISYLDGSGNAEAKLAVCGSASCATSSLIRIAVGSWSNGTSDIVIGADGNPIIAYKSSDITLAICTTATCAGTIHTRYTGVDGFAPSLLVGPDGGVLSSTRPGYTSAGIIACSNSLCEVPRSYQVAAGVYSGAIAGANTSFVMRADGLPMVIVSNYGNLIDGDPTNDNGTLRTIACGNPVCSPFIGVG